MLISYGSLTITNYFTPFEIKDCIIVVFPPSRRIEKTLFTSSIKLPEKFSIKSAYLVLMEEDYITN